MKGRGIALAALLACLEVRAMACSCNPAPLEAMLKDPLNQAATVIQGRFRDGNILVKKRWKGLKTDRLGLRPTTNMCALGLQQDQEYVIMSMGDLGARQWTICNTSAVPIAEAGALLNRINAGPGPDKRTFPKKSAAWIPVPEGWDKTIADLCSSKEPGSRPIGGRRCDGGEVDLIESYGGYRVRDCSHIQDPPQEKRQVVLWKAIQCSGKR